MLVTATKYKLYPDRMRAGTRGSYGVEKMEFVFSDDWDGLAVRVVFHPVRGKPVEVPYLGGEIDIPAEVMRYDGAARYVLSGFRVNESGEVEKKLISLEGYIDVAYAPDDKGSNAKRVTADNYDLLLSQAKKIFDETKADIEQSAEQASNSAENAAESARKADESESSAKANATAASQAEYKAGLSASSATKSASDALISANDAAKFRDDTAAIKSSAEESVEKAKNTAIEEIRQAGNAEIAGITNSVEAAGNAAIEAIHDASSVEAGRIAEAGNDEIKNIRAEAQIQLTNLAIEVEIHKNEAAKSAEEAKASAEAAAKSASESAKLTPVEKTDGMTQPVGRDEDGRLWTEPSGGGASAGITIEDDGEGNVTIRNATTGELIEITDDGEGNLTIGGVVL